MKYVIGLDVGTTGTKAVLVDENGKSVASAYAKTPLVKRGGAVLQDADAWWSTSIEVINKCAEKVEKSDIIGISTSSQGGSLVLTDKSGVPQELAVSWMDAGDDTVKAELSRLDIDYRALTGWSLGSDMCLCKLRRHGSENAEKVLNTADFINYKLTGRFVIDPSDAAMTQLFDVKMCDWSEPLLSLAKVSRNKLSEVADTGENIGHLTASAAKQTGLSESVSVFSGGHDQYCTAYGAGVSGSGSLLIATGTAWVTLAVGKEVPTNADFGAHIVKGLYGTIVDIPSAGVCMEWLRDGFFADMTLAEIDAAVEKIESAPVFVPHFAKTGGASVFGLLLSHDRFSLARAVMEGVCMEVRRATAVYGGIRSVTVTGGATKSRVWMQLLADILGRDIEVCETSDMACAGAALIAGRALGLFDEIKTDKHTVFTHGDCNEKYAEFLRVRGEA